MSLQFAGNKRVIAAVECLIKGGTLPHAILIEGEQGTGRKTLAHHIALSAVCSGAVLPCGECKNCILAKSNNHPDIITVLPEDKKKNISVAQIRTLRSDAYIKPHMGGKKVFIIPLAERMNEQSQNALLKILEEPPQNVIFILITENTSMMLSTIVSRCVVFSLSVPEFCEANEYLKDITKASDDAIAEALRVNRNNIGRALSYLSSRAKSRQNIAATFAEILISGGSAYEMLKAVAPLEKDRVNCADFIISLKAHIAEKIRVRTNQKLTVDTLIRYYDIISDAEPQLTTNINLSLFLSALVCNLRSV